MKRSFLLSVAPIALITFPSLAAGQTAPPMGGGYQNVIPIPVDDPATKNIAGALFKPTGAGPFQGPRPAAAGPFHGARACCRRSVPRAAAHLRRFGR